MGPVKKMTATDLEAKAKRRIQKQLSFGEEQENMASL
jgi:hypothetical protein